MNSKESDEAIQVAMQIDTPVVQENPKNSDIWLSVITKHVSEEAAKKGMSKERIAALVEQVRRLDSQEYLADVWPCLGA